MMVKEHVPRRRGDHQIIAAEGQVRQGEVWPLALAKCSPLLTLISRDDRLFRTVMLAALEFLDEDSQDDEPRDDRASI